MCQELNNLITASVVTNLGNNSSSVLYGGIPRVDKVPDFKSFIQEECSSLDFDLEDYDSYTIVIAEVVIIAAENEDQIAHHILLEESEELVHHISTMMKKMNTIDLRVSFTGSLISNNNIYSDMLRKKIKTSLPSVKIVEPKYSPIEGAILLAKEKQND